MTGQPSCDANASHDKTPEFEILKLPSEPHSKRPSKARILKSKINPFRSAALNGAVVVFACFALINNGAQAADQLWIGSASDHNVTTPGNWGSWVSEGDTCSSWSPFVFGSGVVDGTVNLNRWVAISSITLTSGLTHDITIDNGPIVMGGSLVDMSSAGANLTLNAQVQQGWGDMTFNVGAGRTLTANGGVAESGWFGLHTGLTKNGAGTLVIEGASTYTLDTFINAGTLELAGAGTLGGGSYAGAITNYGAFVHSSSADQTLAVIAGPGSITKSGSGTLTLTSYGVGNTGSITVNSGTLQAPDGPWQQESNHIVVNGGTFSTSDGNSRALSWTLNGGTVSSRGDASPGFWGNIMLYDNQAVTVGGSADSTIASHVMLGMGSGFAVGSGSTLNMTGALSNSVWAGGGNGDLIKSGSGSMTISATSNYTGTTSVNQGKLVVNGSISTSALTTVFSGAYLGGSGMVGALTVNSGAFVTPGNSPGILTVNGNYTQAGQYTAEVTGTTAGSQYDQIGVNGTVDITGGGLVALFSSGSYALGDKLFILLNDGTDAITGTYTGYAQGDVVASYGGFDWQISYAADSTGNTFSGGNDIALMAVPEANVAALIGGLGLISMLRRRR